MKKYFYLVSIVILGHGMLFGIFKAHVPDKKNTYNSKLFLVLESQIRHELGDSLSLSQISGALSLKNSLWSENLCVAKKIGNYKMEEPADVSMTRKPSFKNLSLYVKPPVFRERDVIPNYCDIYYYRLPADIVLTCGEQKVDLENNKELHYLIQGPAAERTVKKIKFPSLEEKTNIELKVRFWVAKNGRVNQVILEEGTGYSAVDKKIIDSIKKWEFRPQYASSANEYQWGIVRIRVV